MMRFKTKIKTFSYYVNFDNNSETVIFFFCNVFRLIQNFETIITWSLLYCLFNGLYSLKRYFYHFMNL